MTLLQKYVATITKFFLKMPKDLIEIQTKPFVSVLWLLYPFRWQEDKTKVLRFQNIVLCFQFNYMLINKAVVSLILMRRFCYKTQKTRVSL